MKFSCNREELSNKLSVVQKAINNNIKLDILKNVLLTVSNDTLELVGYNLEFGITTTLNVEEEEEGQICVNAKFLNDIVKGLSDSVIQISSSDNVMNILCGNSSYNVRVENAEDFVLLPSINSDESLEIPGAEFKQMVRETYSAVGTDETKPLLMGELLEIGSKDISLTAIDGYRMGISKLSFEDDEDNNGEDVNDEENIKIVIPGKVLNDICTIVGKNTEVVEIDFDNRHAMFKVDDITIITRLLEGNFPDSDRLIPKTYNTSVVVGRTELLHALQRALIITSCEKNNLVKLVIKDNLINILGVTQKAQMHEVVGANIDGDDIEIGFNVKYLIDGIKDTIADELNINFTNPTGPCIIKNFDNEEYLHMVSPVRVPSA